MSINGGYKIINLNGVTVEDLTQTVSLPNGTLESIKSGIDDGKIIRCTGLKVKFEDTVSEITDFFINGFVYTELISEEGAKVGYTYGGTIGYYSVSFAIENGEEIFTFTYPDIPTPPETEVEPS